MTHNEAVWRTSMIQAVAAVTIVKKRLTVKIRKQEHLVLQDGIGCMNYSFGLASKNGRVSSQDCLTYLDQLPKASEDVAAFIKILFPLQVNFNN